jgi:hypothetical protein
MPRVIMQFPSSNVPIMRIARRFGMSVVTAAGESNAHLELRLASMPVVIETFTFPERNAKRDVALAWGESIYRPSKTGLTSFASTKRIS